MLNIDAINFVTTEVFPCWPRWNPGVTETQIWADAFRKFSYEDAHASFGRFYTTQDTKFKPSIKAVMGHFRPSGGRIKEWFWLQNTKNGIFHPHYWIGDKEKVLYRLFRTEDAPLGGGEWKMYEQGEISHDELFKYRNRKVKGLRSAIEHLESEQEAAYIIKEYLVDPRSAPAKAIKKKLRELKEAKQALRTKEMISSV